MIRFDQLERLGLRAAVMSERRDGNMSLGYNAEAALENRQRLLTEIKLPLERAVFARQVHGNRVHLVTDADAGSGSVSSENAIADTDALVTQCAQIPLAISVADCCPVLLFDPIRRVIAAIHAGRAGTLAKVSGAAVQVMTVAVGCCPENIHAHIGPSAGPERYEVAESMADEFRAARLAARGCFIDLWESNRRQLIESGLPAAQITCSGVCTITSGHFYSYRRGDTAARNIVVVSL